MLTGSYLIIVQCMSMMAAVNYYFCSFSTLLYRPL